MGLAIEIARDQEGQEDPCKEFRATAVLEVTGRKQAVDAGVMSRPSPSLLIRLAFLTVYTPLLFRMA